MKPITQTIPFFTNIPTIISINCQKQVAIGIVIRVWRSAHQNMRIVFHYKSIMWCPKIRKKCYYYYICIFQPIRLFEWFSWNAINWWKFYLFLLSTPWAEKKFCDPRPLCWPGDHKLSLEFFPPRGCGVWNSLFVNTAPQATHPRGMKETLTKSHCGGLISSRRWRLLLKALANH